MHFGRLIRSRVAGPFAITESAFRPGSALPAHHHEVPYFTFTLRGTYRERYGRRSRVCAPGIVVAHPAFEEHSQEFSIEPTVLIRIAVMEGVADPAADAALEHPRVFTSPSIAGVLANLHRELGSADVWTEAIVEGLAYELVGRALLQTCTTGGSRRRALCARTLIRSLAHGLSLSDIARELGVTRATLYRDFRSAFGYTPGWYLRHFRLDVAATMLQKTTQPISEIAAELGFYDQCHFARSFRRLWGTTPSCYREATS